MTDQDDLVPFVPQNKQIKTAVETVLIEPIWEKQAHLGETDEDYAAFLIYAALPPGDRTIQTTWEQWTQKSTRASSVFVKKLIEFKWRERSSVWDIEKLKGLQQDWLIRDSLRRVADFEIGELFRSIAKQKLEELDLSQISVNAVARFAELASKLQETAVPKVSLEQEEMKNLINTLPEDRRKQIVAILLERYNNNNR